MKKWIGCVVLLCIGGCASTPPSTAVPEVAKIAKPRRIDIRMSQADIKVDGSHHEGALQVPQPWIFGLSSSQKEQLKWDGRLAAIRAFVKEARDLGFEVTENGNGVNADEFYDVKEIIIDLDTYGNGWGGFGGAGNFWRADVTYKIDRISGGPMTSSLARVEPLEVREQAILSPCPAKMNALTILKLVSFAASPSVSLPSASYDVNHTNGTPIELAARLAARKLLLGEFGSSAVIKPLSH